MMLLIAFAALISSQLVQGLPFDSVLSGLSSYANPKPLPVALQNWPASSGQYTLPQNDPSPAARAAAIDVTRANFLYGPPLGGGSYYPTGLLGVAATGVDATEVLADLAPISVDVGLDAAKATADALQVGKEAGATHREYC